MSRTGGELEKHLPQGREAARMLKHWRRHKRRGRIARAVIVGGALALAVSEDLRTRLLDTVFGAEEEFDYESTTEPAYPGDGGGESLVRDEGEGSEPDAPAAESEPATSIGLAEGPVAPSATTEAGDTPAWTPSPAPDSSWGTAADAPTVARPAFSAEHPGTAAPVSSWPSAAEPRSASSEPETPTATSWPPQLEPEAPSPEPESPRPAEPHPFGAPEAASEPFGSALPEDTTAPEPQAPAESPEPAASGDAPAQEEPAVGEAQSPRRLGWWTSRSERAVEEGDEPSSPGPGWGHPGDA